MQNFSQSKSKLGYVYLLTPKGVSEKIALTDKFIERNTSDYEALRAELESLKAEADIHEKVLGFADKRS